MKKNLPKLVGILYMYGENDMSIWFPELTETENNEVSALLTTFIDTGCSVRGTKQDILSEIEESIS